MTRCARHLRLDQTETERAGGLTRGACRDPDLRPCHPYPGRPRATSRNARSAKLTGAFGPRSYHWIMENVSEFAPPKAKTKSIKAIARATAKLWKRHGLDYDSARAVAKAARKIAGLARPARRRSVVDRLSGDEARRLIERAYSEGGARGLMVKTLFQSGTRVAEFVALDVGDFFREERAIVVRRGKGDKGRSIPILPALAHELATHLKGRFTGPLFASTRGGRFTPRRIQQIVKELARAAGIAKRVTPHLLRHSSAQDLLDGGMPLEHVQRFLGHAEIGTTEIYAQSTPAAIRDSHARAAQATAGRA